MKWSIKTGLRIVAIQPVFNMLLLVFSSLICSMGAEYSYSIPYTKTVSQYGDISSPDAGDEIDQMDVQQISVPNQIRLSFTDDPTEMAITWTTNDITHLNEVQYGLAEGNLNNSATSISHQYQWDEDDDGNYAYTSGFIHEALMVNLVPGAIHYYQIYSNGKTSDVIRFIAAPEKGSETPVNIFHIGDAGTFGTSVMVTADMMNRMNKQDFHGLVHCGDMSYADKYNGSRGDYSTQKVWDTWGQMVEPVASKMAYMTSPGNHEIDVYESTRENGTIYQKRFIMPGNEKYYSFAVGMVQFVSVNSDESVDKKSTQGVWLEDTLREINENRDKYPWVVVFQHRPIYNSNANHGNWSGQNTYDIDDKWPEADYDGWFTAFENLLVKYDVDLLLAGHVHQYERSWPVKGRDNVQQSYNDVTAPIHISCGHAGKDLYKWTWDTNNTVDTYSDPAPRFSAARTNTEWGHCELEFLDKNTVRHTMYVMGSTEPKEDVTISKKRSSSALAIHFSLVLVLSLFCWV